MEGDKRPGSERGDRKQLPAFDMECPCKGWPDRCGGCRQSFWCWIYRTNKDKA